VDLGHWLKVGTYEVPLALRIDGLSRVFGPLAALLSLVVLRFSRTYMHREPGFVRFHVLLALFVSGTQLLAWGGSLDVMFAGWELLGWTSALFIGFFQERDEPARSAVRAFATYRLCDAGFLIAIVTVHELAGTTRLAGLDLTPALPAGAAALVAALFLLAAAGKAALFPFSGWLARAMEGPTPSSALFYGGISLHAGVFLMLRTWSLVDAGPVLVGVAVALGLLTTVYGSLVARVQPDAKGALAHATLAQVGLIVVEIAMGWNRLALWHLAGHACLRAWQYLRAPNTLHDAHRLGHAAHAERGMHPALYAAALHRFRLDAKLDAVVAPVRALALAVDAADRAWRRAFGAEDE
jgi:NADH:ubiquinone oxidoreductase subunit 5 (subunit L)/multisubunit Na+/H+ antiporter MnhA subunit